MANNTIPMTDMFETCSEILDSKLVPLHYANLVELALDKLSVPKVFVNWQRQIEDVREKMLIAGQYDTFYVGKPFCLAAKYNWFETNQPRLLQVDWIPIPGHARRGANGAFEALMRDPYMLVKTRAIRARVAMGRASGIVLEKHVAGWFKDKWPEFYQPPDNEGVWTQVCDHDFKLKIDDRTFKIDVSGPKSNGQFGNPGGGKKGVDLHLLCEIIGQNVIWKSVCPGKNYKNAISPLKGRSPIRMVVWLNCISQGIDYQAIRDFALNGHNSKAA